jgi:hypothetical protein
MLIYNQEVEMVSLSSCEILDELKKLGVQTSSELIQYVIEYTAYYSVRNMNLEALKD